MDLLYRVKTLWAALRGNHYTWPAIDITLPGNRHFHLIGSIHMGSHDMAPLPTRLLKKLKNADALIVEADVSTSDTPFANLPACEALEERISEEQLQNLQHISQEMGISPSSFLPNRCGKSRWFFRRRRHKNWGCGQNTVSITSYCRRRSNNINP